MIINNDDGTVTIENADLENDTQDEIDLNSVTDEKLKKDLQSAIAKKKAWREKAIDPATGKSYKDLFDSLKTQKTQDTTTKKETEETETIKKDIASLKEESAKRVFQHANKLSPDQVDEVFAYAKGMGIEPKIALDKPFIKKVLEQMNADEQSSNASLVPSRRAPVQVGGKTFKDMSPEERKKAFPSFSKSR